MNIRINNPAVQEPKPSNLVQTIERVATIMDILSEYSHGLSLGDLSTEAGLPKGTTHRLVSSLVYFGFVRQDFTSKKYLLGFKLMELGNVVLSKMDLRNEARSELIHLAEVVQETVHLVVRDNNEVLYIDKVEPHPMNTGLQMVSKLGTRIPMHSSSVGKILLAYLPDEKIEQIINDKGLPGRTANTITDPTDLKENLKRIRTQGYAIDNEENEMGVRCVAAPIRDMTGKVVAAMSISTPTARVTMKLLKSKLKEQVTKTAGEISAKFGFAGL
jgi:DNA-binding IclR family transcriptional regulator